MNEKTPLSPTHAARRAYANHIKSMRPARKIVTVTNTLTSYFRAIGVIAEHQQWRSEYNTLSGIDRFAILCEHFDQPFAVALLSRDRVAREAYIQWVEDYLTPEEKVLLARRAAVEERKAQFEESQELANASIDMRRALQSNAAADIRVRRQLFVNYLKTRKGPCLPARTYRRWRGYEEKWMRHTRLHVHGYEPSALPARGYHIRKDVEAVLGAACVPLIFKAPRTTRCALATQIEEL